MTAENFDGNSSANTTIIKPQNSTATTQSQKSATQTTLPSATEKQLNNRGISAVTADTDDDFLRGFYADDREAQVRFQPHPYTPPQTTTQATFPSAEYKSLKPLNNRGITQVTVDDFLRGFNKGYEDELRTQTYPSQQTRNQTSKPSTGNGIRKDLNRGIMQVTADDFLRGFNKGYEENEIVTAPERREPNLWDLTVNSYKQGYNNAARGQEAWKSMHGQKNELDKYNELLSSDEYNFETDDWWEKILSGASQQVGQWVRQLSDPDTLALAMGSGGAALLAGQAGPQALLPEEVLTVPGAFALGMKAGNAKTNMEIEGGRAYLEMLNNGVSEETARAIATGVGGINALLETAQLDELLKAYKVLGKAGADDAFLDVVLRELKNRGIDTVTETLQEDGQELVTIAGTQLGSKIDTGEWAYNLAEVLQRLWDTTKESALTFGLTNIPSTVHNVTTQNHNHLVAEGKGNILYNSKEYENKQSEIKKLVCSDEIPKTVNYGHQNKHIPTAHGYTEERSYIHGDLNTAQDLIDRYSGTGEYRMNKNGEWTKKEFIVADHIIGVYVNPETGIAEETNRFCIHYGKNGTHIVPARRKK